jgi:CRISPR-associated protein Csx17
VSELRLEGCTPEPLMAYLKALGVLRIVTEQAERGVCGRWRDGVFVLQSNLDREGLIHFFLEHYRPTPIIAPWAGGSGFFGADNRVALDAIVKSGSGRLTEFAALINQVRGTLMELRIKSKPSPEEKERLLRRYRRDMPDGFVDWMDTALVLQTAGQSFPPLLGTGGNDGRLDFTQNYIQRLISLGFGSDALVPGAAEWLRQTLYAEPARDMISAAVGQFDPGRAGGPNATMGMEGSALVNPWDFILMLEGALILAGAATRRLGVGQHDRASFPFTVRPSTVGYGSEAYAEEADSRGEIWLPLWQTQASLGELRLVFAEGRAETNGHQSRDAVDFARAASSLGTDRGIDAFVRYGFLRRSGKSFVATPLGTFPVRSHHATDLLREADPWLDSLRWSVSGDDVPTRFRTSRHRVETSIFDYCRYAHGEDDSSWFQPVISALGAAERELGIGDAPPDKRRVRKPFAGLSSEWLNAGDDGSREFRLARSLAFMTGGLNKTGPIRNYMEPVEWNKGAWWWSDRGGRVVWSGGDLARNLGAILIRRIMDAQKAGETPLPLASLFPTSLADVAAFASGQTDDQKLEELLWGLILVNSQGAARPRTYPDEAFVLPRAYALLKLTLLPGRLDYDGTVLRLNQTNGDEIPTGIAVKPEPAVLGRLRAGDVAEACAVAARRLRSSGFVPLASHLADGSRRDNEWSASSISPVRLLASLLFPISSQSVKHLADLVLRRPKVETPG